MLVGNYAESRCYLGDFLRDAAGDDPALIKAVAHYGEIHDTCWQIWAAAGGWQNPESYKALRDAEKRETIVKLIRKVQALDFAAIDALKAWDSSHK